MTALPTGTVTFLFTDIEGSTRLLQELGSDQYGQVLADQRRILRKSFTKWHGQEVDTQGDSFFVSFTRATEAVSAANEIQRALVSHTWPGNVDVRVRMGLHTGEPIKAEEGYVGMDVHRAARIAHVGHGGQVLLSETTAALVLDDLPQGVTFIDLGRHLLKDIRRPEHIRQLVMEDLPGKFPPLMSLEKLPSAELREPRHVGECPYRGLAAFREADAQFFYGRETFTERLEIAVKTKPLVAVIVGSSGSGKSSVVFAGLLPKLRGSGGWQVAVIRPGNQPFYALGSTLLPLLVPELSEIDQLVETQKLSEHLTSGEVNLYRVVERILENGEQGEQILLVVDQFEELYTLCSDLDIRRRFIDELLTTEKASSERHPSPVVILLTMRADFMGQALRHRPFADALQDVSLILGPMTRQELREAIEKPGELQGAAFEPGLVERILDDVGTEPGNLPLLEFAMTLLWERESDGWLTHENYEMIGCVEGALASYADEVFSSLDENEKEIARRIFVQLVRPGEGTEDTRRVANFAELDEESWTLVHHLADSRLIVTGRDAGSGEETVEVVHEALIQRWDRLKEWMEADRAFRTWQERLRVALHEWELSDRDTDTLLRGALLITAEDWLSTRGSELIEIERDFIHASVTFRENEQKRRGRRRRWTLATLSAGLMLTIVLTVFVLLQRQNSQRQAAILLAGQAEVELANGYHDRAILLALTAMEDYPYTSQAERALGQAVSYNRALQLYTPHQSAVTSIAWSSDGKLIASSGSSDNNVHIWDPSKEETVLVIDMPQGITGNILDMALNVSWTPDSKQLLTMTGDRYSLGSQDYDVQLWDAVSGDLISNVEIPNQAEPVSGELSVSFVQFVTGGAVAIAPQSNRLATLGGDNSAIVWDVSWQRPVVNLRGHEDSVNSVDWSPDETKLVTASMDGKACVWDTHTGQLLFTLDGHGGRVNVATWSPDGLFISTGNEDGTLRVWNATGGELVRSIETNAGEVTSLTWAPNSVRIISGQVDGSIHIWEVASGSLLDTMRGHEGIITDLEWSPVDDRLASADSSGNVRVWNVAPSTAWRLYPPQAESGEDWSVQGINWSSDGRYLTMAGGDGVNLTDPPSFAIWDVQENRLIMENLGDVLNLMGLAAAFSPDDKAILYLGLKGFPDFSEFATAYVFDSRNAEIIQTFTPGGEHLIRSVAWSPDGSQIATGLFNGEIWIWDYGTGELITKLTHDNEGMINYVEWSPDGTKIAAASDGSVAVVWDAHTLDLLYIVEHEPPTFVIDAAWSPDSKRLLTTAGNDEQGAKDNTARIWNGATGEELLIFNGHTKSVWPGDWSPDGKRIATFSNDGTVKVWDASTGDELLELSVPVLYGGAAQWSPDGQYLSISGLETLVSVWRVWQSADELVAYAKECCIIRELTSDERQQFGLSPQ